MIQLLNFSVCLQAHFDLSAVLGGFTSASGQGLLEKKNIKQRDSNGVHPGGQKGAATTTQLTFSLIR